MTRGAAGPGGAAGLVLAAGAGRRMGGPKALVRVQGQPLLQRAVGLLRAGGCDPVHVVVGAAAQEVAALVPDCRVVVNPDWDSGMASSLRAGLTALGGTDAERCVVALVDQPLLGAEAVRRLLAAPGPAAVATYGGAPRNPVRLDRAVWAEVAAVVQGDEGARRWLGKHPDRVTSVPCDDTGSPLDVDTPDELAELVRTEEPA